ncbi:hypothetical protein VitviT2T_002317 [Vitis vinifera]|uniref:Bifunctional inhibitor/plant lipid transfer protein/seed storage helical domain-containing protein n=1 Tax=Vitis vinifera TaxID=29760 RepID=A0ABY9BJ01_VITVI|nr:hypothetical protein VitviT2T_002317 [Vitis vinifera]
MGPGDIDGGTVVVLGVWEGRMASATGKSPTPACCQSVRVTHLECVCPVITPKLAALVDVNRMIKLVDGCGRRLPRHDKCGTMLFFYLSLSLTDSHTLYS